MRDDQPMQPAPFGAAPPSPLPPGSAPAGNAEWLPNAQYKRTLRFSAIYLIIAGVSIAFWLLLASVGLSPGLITMILTPYFVFRGALGLWRRSKMPRQTGLSWDAIHIGYRDRQDVFPLQTMAAITSKIGVKAGLGMRIELTDGTKREIAGIDPQRVAELSAFVARRRTEMAALGGAATFAGPPPAAPDGAPMYARAAGPAPEPGSPAARWNASRLPDGREVPDATIAAARSRTQTIPTGVWLSADPKSLKRQMMIMPILVFVFPLLIIFNIGLRTNLNANLTLTAAVGSGAGLSLVVWLFAKREVSGEVGRAVLQLPPTLTSQEAAKQIVADALAKANTPANSVPSKMGVVRWAVTGGSTITLSQGAKGRAGHLAIVTKGSGASDAHRALKGHILAALHGGPPANALPAGPG